jgi:small-conductance mechanosensitive channel
MAAQDNLDARRAQTQFRVLKKIGIFLIVLVAVATALMTFEGFRRAGIGIFTSAGVIGVVVGFAAQKTLAGRSVRS